MPSFYELTQEEVELLLNALDYYTLDHDDMDEVMFTKCLELKEFLQTRERKVP